MITKESASCDAAHREISGPPSMLGLFFLALGRYVGCRFFFSSRRRHTRSLRDWSSDVCSSDLRHRQRGQANPQPGARRLVHLAEDQGGVLDDVGVRHLDEQVVALAGALPHPGEHGHPGRLRDPGDHLLDEHGLAHPGAAEQADLAALDVWGEQIQHLDAGLQDLGPRLQLVEWRRIAMDPPALGDLQRRGGHVERLAEHVEDVTLGDIADGDRDRAAGVRHRRPADQAIGGLHRDGADDVVADVLGDFQGQRPYLVTQRDVYLQGVVDVGNLRGGKLHVNHGADDPHNTAGGGASGIPAFSGGIFYGCGHVDAHLLPAIVSASALAPPTISLITWVISAWRALFASRVSCSSKSLALSVADFIARRRAAISAAADSSSAWKILLSTYHGSRASSTAPGDGSNS